MRTSLSSVPIVGPRSLSALMIRNSSRPKATLTSPSAVLNVVRQGSQSAPEVAVTEPHVRCSPQHAANVAKTPKYLLNLAVIAQSTVVIATAKRNRVGINRY